MCCLPETYFKDINRLRIKEQLSIYQANTSQKKAGVAT